MKSHLAIFSQFVIHQIFEGKKEIEARFSIRKIPPFALVEKGDVVFIKPPGEDIVGQFKVKKVLYIDGMDLSDWEYIEKNYLKKMGSKTENLKYLQEHSKAKYATIIFMNEVEQFITSPIRISKKDQRGWMVL